MTIVEPFVTEVVKALREASSVARDRIDLRGISVLELPWVKAVSDGKERLPAIAKRLRDAGLASRYSGSDRSGSYVRCASAIDALFYMCKDCIEQLRSIEEERAERSKVLEQDPGRYLSVAPVHLHEGLFRALDRVAEFAWAEAIAIDNEAGDADEAWLLISDAAQRTGVAAARIHKGVKMKRDNYIPVRGEDGQPLKRQDPDETRKPSKPYRVRCSDVRAWAKEAGKEEIPGSDSPERPQSD